jgi:hypothetical protein
MSRTNRLSKSLAGDGFEKKSLDLLRIALNFMSQGSQLSRQIDQRRTSEPTTKKS